MNKINYTMSGIEPVPGRNDACACGSGKKYKKCCHLKGAAIRGPSTPGTLLVCMPIRDRMEPETALALERNLSLPFQLLTEIGLPVDIARNRLAESARKSTAEYVVWIDSDCWFEPGTIETKIRALITTASVSVVAAYCSGRLPFSASLAFANGTSLYPVALGEPVPIDWATMHLVVHRRSLLDRLGDHPFTLGEHDLGEDQAFYRLVRECGAGKIVVLNSGSVVAHMDKGVAFLPGLPPGRIVNNRFEVADARSQEEIVAEYNRMLASRETYSGGVIYSDRSYGPSVDAAIRKQVEAFAADNSDSVHAFAS